MLATPTLLHLEGINTKLHQLLFVTCIASLFIQSRGARPQGAGAARLAHSLQLHGTKPNS